jgi:hypothetical protein
VICQGTSTTLRATYTGLVGPGQTVVYQWTPVTGLSNPNIAQPLASPTATTQYRVYAYSAGCTLTAVTSVIVNPSPLVQAGVDVRIVPGSSIRLEGRVTGGAAPVQYSWSPVTGLSNPLALDPVASPTTTTDYVLTATSGNGCVRSDTIRITVDSTAGYLLGGRVLYDNAQLTPLPQATVTLEFLGSAPIPVPLPPGGTTGVGHTNAHAVPPPPASGLVEAQPHAIPEARRRRSLQRIFPLLIPANRR